MMMRELSLFWRVTLAVVLLVALMAGLTWLTWQRAPLAGGVKTSTPCEQPRHLVQAGETLNGIAQRYGVTANAIARLNAISETELTTGQVLAIPICAEDAVVPTITPPPVFAERLSLGAAARLVREWVFSNQPKMNPAASFPLTEITPPGAWEQMQVQVFKVTGQMLSSQSFAIAEGKVYPIGESFGGVGVHTLMVADLEKDGAPELIYAYGFGSGIHQSSIGMLRRAVGGDFAASSAAGLRYLGDLTVKQDAQQGVLARGIQEGASEMQTLGRLQVQDDVLTVVPIDE